ncbi:MAG: hypothetical protein IPK83_20950 [Planctomycetes bacterium]|nr:hypothetical protein [Planctomycetota bacterium]
MLEDPEVDEHFDIIRGAVVWHSKDRDEVYQKMLELKPKAAATIFVGSMPENTAMLLRTHRLNNLLTQTASLFRSSARLLPVIRLFFLQLK